MSEKIKSISEAFSMQPIHLFVCTKKTDEISFGEECPHEHDQHCIKEIKLEYNKALEENQYVGYDSEGKKMFEYLQSSVNVQYE
jgi:hypothetical protein